MKNLFIGGIVCLFCVLFLLGTWGLAANCKVPNQNTVKCHNVDNQTTGSLGCNSVTTQADCGGMAEYEINDFPDGTEDADEGVTKQDSGVECYRTASCYWSTQLNKCVANGILQEANWHGANKTVADETKTCPVE